MTLTSGSDYPAKGPKMAWAGHVLSVFRAVEEPPYAKCEACGLKLAASDAMEGTVSVEPCRETEDGRRLWADLEREEPAAPIITEPCIATPPDWEGTDAEAVGLAVAGAVADLQRQRDEQAAETAKAMDLLAALVKAYPATSWAASNVALQQAKDYLGLGIDPAPEQ